MSITSPDDRITSYNPVATTTTFAADFPVFDNDDIKVFVDGEERTDFAVSATYVQGISNDARAVFNPGITGHVQVVGARDPRRTNRFLNGAPLQIWQQNLALDTVEAEVQEAKRDINRSHRAPYGEEGGVFTASDIGKAQGYAEAAFSSKETASEMAGTATAAAQQAVQAAANAQPEMDSRSYAIVSYHPVIAPNKLRTAGYAAPGDGGGALYKKVSSEPSHTGKFSITLDDGATVVWYEIVVSGALNAAALGSGQAAIEAAHDIADDIIIDRDFAITSTATWPNGKNYLFINGGKLSVATGVTLTIRGIVHAGQMQGLPSSAPRQIFDCAGTGEVVGVRKVKPEWWGAAGDGIEDDRPALQAAHDCVEASYASDGADYDVELRGGAVYGLSSTLILRPRSC